MRSVSDGASALAFRMWGRAGDSAEWVPGSRLLVRVDDGGSEALAQLSWVTEDGADYAVAFSPDMAACYGHRRATDGAVVEIRGELDEGQDQPEAACGGHGYEFDTELEEAGAWHPAGRLKVLVDDGTEAPARWLAWSDRSGNAGSVALRAAASSGSADVSDLVRSVWASAENGPHEVAANLVKAAARKWLAFHDRASLEFQLTRPVAVERYVLTSANDAPDRDPSAWTLRGSTDGRLWRVLDTRSGQSFGRRHHSQAYLIAEPGSYDHYRLEITGTNGSRHLQLETVRFLADSGVFVGFRQAVGQAPVAYRGTRVVQASPDLPPEPLPEGAPTSPKTSAPLSKPGVTSASGSTEPPRRLEEFDGESIEPVVIRTDFTDQEAWDLVVEGLAVEWAEESEPYLISDPGYAGASTEWVLQAVRSALPEQDRPDVIFIADGTTMQEANHALLAVSTEWDGEPFADDEEDFVTQFRLLPNVVMEVSVNLGLGNMDFDDFAGDGRQFEH